MTAAVRATARRISDVLDHAIIRTAWLAEYASTRLAPIDPIGQGRATEAEQSLVDAEAEFETTPAAGIPPTAVGARPAGGILPPLLPAGQPHPATDLDQLIVDVIDTLVANPRAAVIAARLLRQLADTVDATQTGPSRAADARVAQVLDGKFPRK